MERLSMDYYAGIFRNNPDKIPMIKDLLVKDFKAMEVNFFSAVDKRDIHTMRAELHKMYPIISNLRFSEMLSLLEKYRNHKEYSDELNILNEQLRNYFSNIYDFLLPR